MNKRALPAKSAAPFALVSELELRAITSLTDLNAEGVRKLQPRVELLRNPGFKNEISRRQL